MQTCSRLLVLAASAISVSASLAGADQRVRPLSDLPGGGALVERWLAVMDDLEVPGGAVAVVKDGGVYAEAWGIRSIEPERPVTTGTVFYSASVTKTFVGACVLRLAGDGVLALDDRVQRHLPRFTLPDSALAARTTVEDLLCFKDGLNCGECSVLDAFTGEITEDRYWHWMERARINGSPRYNNTSFTLLGRVLTSATGKPWQACVEELIATPAGLDSITAFMSEVEETPDHAQGLVWDRDANAWRVETQRKTDRTMHAAGGLAFSVVDGARWLGVLLNEGRAGAVQVVPEDLVERMISERVPLVEARGSGRRHTGFGYAWDTGEFNGHRYCGRGGDYPGFALYSALLPDDDAGLYIALNTGGRLAAGLREVMIRDLMALLTGTEQEEDPLPRVLEPIERARETGDWSGVPSAIEPVRTMSAVGLSRPIGLYEGVYRNEHLGTLRVTREGDGLRVTLGDMDCAPEASSGPADAFVLGGWGRGASAEFLVEPTGWVRGVRVVDADDGPIEFVR